MRRNERCIRVSRTVSPVAGEPFFMRKSIIEDKKTMSAPLLKPAFTADAQPVAAPVIQLRAHHKAAAPLPTDYRFVADIDRDNGDYHIIRGYN